MVSEAATGNRAGKTASDIFSADQPPFPTGRSARLRGGCGRSLKRKSVSSARSDRQIAGRLVVERPGFYTEGHRSWPRASISPVSRPAGGLGGSRGGGLEHDAIAIDLARDRQTIEPKLAKLALDFVSKASPFLR